jgi:hypothetical protein
VGGKLSNSLLRSEKELYIIPHSRAELRVRGQHQEPGPQYMLASLRQEYWIPRGRQEIRSPLHKFVPYLKKTGCCMSGNNVSAPNSTGSNGKTIFELWHGLCRAILCQTRISKEQNSSEMLCRHFYLLAVKVILVELVSKLTSYSQLMSPEGLLLNKSEMFKFVFLQMEQHLLELMVKFQNSGKLLASATHQSKFFGIWNSESIYMPFSIFLDDAYLDYSNLLPKNSAKSSDVAKMLDVSPAQCQKSFSI